MGVSITQLPLMRKPASPAQAASFRLTMASKAAASSGPQPC